MRKTTVVRSVVFGVAISMIGGCATILSGTSQNITINSEPPGAHVKLGHQSGKIPVTFSIPKGKDYPIEVKYESKKKLLSLSRSEQQNPHQTSPISERSEPWLNGIG